MLTAPPSTSSGAPLDARAHAEVELEHRPGDLTLLVDVRPFPLEPSEDLDRLRDDAFRPRRITEQAWIAERPSGQDPPEADRLLSLSNLPFLRRRKDG